MFRKGTIMLITVLSCLALICVGFSSWATMTGDLNAQTTGGISSESVIYSDEYVKVTVVSTEENFVVTPSGFASGKNTCPVHFEIKDAAKDFAADNQLKIRLTLSFQNDLDRSLESVNLFNNIIFSVNKSGAAVDVTSDYTTTLAEFSFTVNDVASLAGNANALEGTLTFNHTGNFYTNYLYRALAVDATGNIGNPFTLVVAVSNGN